MHLGFVLHPVLYSVAMCGCVLVLVLSAGMVLFSATDLKIINDFDLILRSCSCFYIV